MKGADTNILIRYLVQDDVQQAAQVNELLDRLVQNQEACLINDIVLCESIWVLETIYRYTKQSRLFGLFN